MKNGHYQPSITVFKSLFNSKDTPYQVDIGKIMTRIKEGGGNSKTKEIVQKIRKSKDKKEIDNLKKSLPALMFNGTFQTRDDVGMQIHSGLCIIDFDKYTSEEELEKERARIESDPFTYACFLSPSGNGLKVLIKIPKSSKEEHVRRFHAYKKYIASDYFDIQNSNLSRVCFDSFDPLIFWNPESLLFEKVNEEEQRTYENHVPQVLLTDESKIISTILKFPNLGNFAEGNRNNYVLKLACLFCEYDINQSTAEGWFSDLACQTFGHAEIIQTVRSAYKRAAMNPKKFFEDYTKKSKIEKKLKEGNEINAIAKELNIDEQSVKDVKQNIENISHVFWEVKKTKSGKFIKIISHAYNNFLTVNGFNKYYPEKAESPVFVRIVENKVKIVSTDQIKDFVLNWLKEKNEIEIWDFMAEFPRYFSENYLNYLNPIFLQMIQDTKDEGYIPYSNGILRVTKNKKELLDYLYVENYIWENQIIQRDYLEKSNFKNDFQDMVSKVTNEDANRTLALECTIGYLIHAYKDKTHQKAIIFNDENIDDNPNGGSGKSLMVTALSKFRNVVKIDGKQFNPAKSDFVYQRINLDTQILAFDDVKRNFDLEQLFAIITEGVTVNKKNKDEIFIPFERSPKVVITTNYVIAGAGESHDRRRHEIEFHQFFNRNNSPLKVYNKLLFDQWSSQDWVNFDNYMVNCLQKYLVNGLVASPSINIETKRFISSTSKEFFDFMNDGFIEPNKPIYNSNAINLFIKENKALKDLDTRKFIKWMDSYCNYLGYELKKSRDKGGRFFIINTEQIDPDQTEMEF